MRKLIFQFFASHWSEEMRDGEGRGADQEEEGEEVNNLHKMREQD